MRDKRPVDELSIEELERILAIKKREARQGQLERMKRSGRVMPSNAGVPVQQAAPVAPLSNGGGAAKPAPSVRAAVASPVTAKAAVSASATPRFEDDPSDIEAVGDPAFDEARQQQAWKRFINTTLLLVEVAAVAGLLFIIVNFFTAVDTLESETRNAQAGANATRQASLPTLAPTPTLRLDQVVLPGGHIIDQATGQGIINFDEIPDNIPTHLLATVQTQLLRPVVARPQPTSETALAISIPKLEIDQTIIPGADWEALQAGVGQVLNGATPHDDDGNVVLAAHNDIYGEWFRHLDELEAGDRFFIQTETAIHTYEVTHWEIVDPTDVHVMENQGRPMATLISCYPYKVNTKRIVVYANRVDNNA